MYVYSRMHCHEGEYSKYEFSASTDLRFNVHRMYVMIGYQEMRNNS